MVDVFSFVIASCRSRKLLSQMSLRKETAYSSRKNRGVLGNFMYAQYSRYIMVNLNYSMILPLLYHRILPFEVLPIQFSPLDKTHYPPNPQGASNYSPPISVSYTRRNHASPLRQLIGWTSWHKRQGLYLPDIGMNTKLPLIASKALHLEGRTRTPWPRQTLDPELSI